jgi:hypothetical protein
LPNVEAVFGPKGAERVFDTETGLSKIDDKSVDIVVMCNVLHEIPPEDWKKLFGANGTVPRLLKARGRLLILEDMEIPHGELAHRFGFLLLDDAHLRKLMACTEADPERILTVSVRDDRLKVHAIPRSLLGRTTPESTKAALRGCPIGKLRRNLRFPQGGRKWVHVDPIPYRLNGCGVGNSSPAYT